KWLLDGSDSSTVSWRYYWQWNRGVPMYSQNAAVRERTWKLVRPAIRRGIVTSPSSLKPLLFNLDEDPTELKDVSSEYPAIYSYMKVLLEDWSRKVEAD